ncbi:GPW/gp25 family protein [Photorhabdus sp. P32]|uniref:GPW/gp25 family protein n=1 Tax=Photorhabdus TaxID=29487 RepID=UPI001CEDD079|nr:GPW/gp25 family protein [Photorhabdus antumapuensis]MCA6221926.1 GPW/gp25 family protein [Photorhabdus antumapuensis]
MNTNSHSAFWQFALKNSGKIACGLDDIAQAILIILRTPCGSDPHRPEFGSNLHLYIDYPIDRAIPHIVRESVDAITRWEPRCQLLSVNPTVNGEHLTLRVNWTAVDGITQSTELLWR